MKQGEKQPHFFKRFDDETAKLIQENHYTLIMDAVMCEQFSTAHGAPAHSSGMRQSCFVGKSAQTGRRHWERAPKCKISYLGPVRTLQRVHNFLGIILL